MRIGSMEIGPGEKKAGWIPVEGTSWRLPVTVICGGAGKTTLITAGIHSAEHVGVQAVIELAGELQPSELDGTVILVPVVNVSGYGYRGTSMVREDGKNLNREFPGSREGTTAEKICRTVTDILFPAADYYIDLHCGDYFEDLYPYVYYVGPVEEKVREAARAMASCVDVKYVVESQITTGGAYNYASAAGIPSVLLERGGRGLWSRDEVDADKADVRRVLEHIYGDAWMAESEQAGRADNGQKSEQQAGDDKNIRPVEAGQAMRQAGGGQTVLTDVRYIDAPGSGCWYPFFSAGDICGKGAVLGEVRDYFGNVIHICRAAERCVILYQTVSLNLPAGSPMVAYGVL